MYSTMSVGNMIVDGRFGSILRLKTRNAIGVISVSGTTVCPNGIPPNSSLSMIYSLLRFCPILTTACQNKSLARSYLLTATVHVVVCRLCTSSRQTIRAEPFISDLTRKSLESASRLARCREYWLGVPKAPIAFAVPALVDTLHEGICPVPVPERNSLADLERIDESWSVSMEYHNFRSAGCPARMHNILLCLISLNLHRYRAIRFQTALLDTYGVSVKLLTDYKRDLSV